MHEVEEIETSESEVNKEGTEEREMSGERLDLEAVMRTMLEMNKQTLMEVTKSMTEQNLAESVQRSNVKEIERLKP